MGLHKLANIIFEITQKSLHVRQQTWLSNRLTIK